jgi:hypothetical protein
MLRFIPYVGTAIAFALPLLFSFAYFEGWRGPVEIVVLFGVVEISLNSFLEPVIYGKTTGVTALGLLVAAMFWTWLWGTLGLLLSTPMTVSLAVLGKYVPSLRFFATILGDTSALTLDARLYQRLVAFDHDGAREILDSALKERTRIEVFDTILVPTLSRTDADAAIGELDELEQAFVWNFVSEVLDELEPVRGFDSPADSSAAWGSEDSEPSAAEGAMRIAGLATQDTSDTLVLRMLGQLLTPSGISLEILEDLESSLTTAERLDAMRPKLVVVSHLPPAGLTPARYLVRRIRAHFADLPIVLGHWGSPSTMPERLIPPGSSRTVYSLADARDTILGVLNPELKPEAETAPLPA